MCSRVLLTFQHRAGVSPYTSTCNVFARTCVFNKQSLPSLLCGHTQRTPHKGDCRTWPPFSRSYGGILPSSLTIVHPNALVSSTRPPVSVSGTGRAHTSLEAFLDSTGTSNIPKPGYASRLTHKCRTDLPILRATRLHHNPISGLDYQSVSPHRLATNDQDPTHHTPTNTQRVNINGSGWLVQPSHHWSRIHGYGTINPLSIDYACRPRLRSRLTLGRLASPRNP